MWKITICYVRKYIAEAQNVNSIRPFYLTKYLPESTLEVPPSHPLGRFHLIFMEKNGSYRIC